MPSHPATDGSSESALSSTVARLEALVVDQSEPGERLPSEGDLASRLGVSRLTVREALKVLAGRGLVELSNGRRPVVRAQQSSVLADFFTVALRRDPGGMLDLNRIRQELEALSATLSARNAGRAGLAALDAALDRMAAAASRADALGEASPERASAMGDYHRADVDFHAALAMASGNHMLAMLLESLADALRESFAASARGHFARGGRFDEVLDAHRAVVEAVRRGDARGAERAMRAHLTEAARDLRADMRTVLD